MKWKGAEAPSEFARANFAQDIRKDGCPAATFARIEKGIRGRKILLATCAATIITYARRGALPARVFAFAFAFARSRSAYTRWILTCDIHVHGTHFLCTVLVQLARRGARDWPRRYDATGHSYVRRLTNVKKTSCTRGEERGRNFEGFAGDDEPGDLDR